MSKAPRDLGIDKSKRNIYDSLQQDWSPFARSKKRFMKDIFYFAALIGYKLKLSKPLKNREASIPLRSFSDDELWILKSLAIAKEGLKILQEEKRLFTLIEEYANAGLNEIYNIVSDVNTDPDLALEDLIRSFITNEILNKDED